MVLIHENGYCLYKYLYLQRKFKRYINKPKIKKYNLSVTICQCLPNVEYSLYRKSSLHITFSYATERTLAPNDDVMCNNRVYNK